MTTIKQILTAKLDGFEFFLALTLGAFEAYWLGGGALGALLYQFTAIAVFKAAKVAVDRYVKV